MRGGFLGLLVLVVHPVLRMCMDNVDIEEHSAAIHL